MLTVRLSLAVSKHPALVVDGSSFSHRVETHCPLEQTVGRLSNIRLIFVIDIVLLIPRRIVFRVASSGSEVFES